MLQALHVLCVRVQPDPPQGGAGAAPGEPPIQPSRPRPRAATATTLTLTQTPTRTPRPSQDLIDKLMADDAHRFGGGASVPGGRDAAASAVGASATDGEQTARSHSHTPASPQ